MFSSSSLGGLLGDAGASLPFCMNEVSEVTMPFAMHLLGVLPTGSLLNFLEGGTPLRDGKAQRG